MGICGGGKPLMIPAVVDEPAFEPMTVICYCEAVTRCRCGDIDYVRDDYPMELVEDDKRQDR